MPKFYKTNFLWTSIAPVGSQLKIHQKSIYLIIHGSGSISKSKSVQKITKSKNVSFLLKNIFSWNTFKVWNNLGSLNKYIKKQKKTKENNFSRQFRSGQRRNIAIKRKKKNCCDTQSAMQQMNSTHISRIHKNFTSHIHTKKNVHFIV